MIQNITKHADFKVENNFSAGLGNGFTLNKLNMVGMNPYHLIPAWISNYIHYKLWGEITYPFLNFNGATVEV